MRNLFWGFFLIGIGMLLLLDNLDLLSFGEVIADFWPLFLILFGLRILLRKKTGNAAQPDPRASSQSQANDAASFTMAQPVEGELVHQSNVFGDLFLIITSQNFKGGSASAVFGDIDIDLSKAALADGDHALHVHSIFGSTRIILPTDAAVTINGSSTFGNVMALGQFKKGFSTAVSAATPGYESAAKRLQINVSNVFGNARVS